MPHLARSGAGGARRAKSGTWNKLRAWHDARSRASMYSARGWAWAAVLAASFFWLSNPLVYVRVFADSVSYTITWTAIVAVLSLPWLRVPRIPWPWVLFLALCVASQLWTIDDAATDAAVVLYLKLTALAVLAAASCDAEVVAWGMGLGGVAIVVLSIHAYENWMWGSRYLNEFGYNFAGVGTNENILAYTLALSLAAVLALGRPRPPAVQVVWFLVLGVHAYGLYRASSGTGYLATLGVLLAGAAVVLSERLRGVPGRLVAAWAAGVSLLVVAALLVVTIGLDKDLLTVSGRTPFWRASIAATLDQAPWLGSGWGAVWAHPWAVAPPNPVADEIYARAGLSLPHGHNFFVDVLPELGIVGVVLVVAMVLYAIRAIRGAGVASWFRGPGERPPRAAGAGVPPGVRRHRTDAHGSARVVGASHGGGSGPTAGAGARCGDRQSSCVLIHSCRAATPSSRLQRGAQSSVAEVASTVHDACRTSPSRYCPVTCGSGAEW